MQKGLSNLVIIMLVVTLSLATVGWYVYSQYLKSAVIPELTDSPSVNVPSIANTQVPELKTDDDVKVEIEALLKSDLDQLEAELDIDIDDLEM